jgi:hypothetical protein
VRVSRLEHHHLENVVVNLMCEKRGERMPVYGRHTCTHAHTCYPCTIHTTRTIHSCLYTTHTMHSYLYTTHTMHSCLHTTHTIHSYRLVVHHCLLVPQSELVVLIRSVSGHLLRVKERISVITIVSYCSYYIVYLFVDVCGRGL